MVTNKKKKEDMLAKSRKIGVHNPLRIINDSRYVDIRRRGLFQLTRISAG